MSTCTLSVPGNAVAVTGPAKSGDPVTLYEVFGTESLNGQADWRTLLFDCQQPANLTVRWAVGSAHVSVEVTVARGSTLCVFAKSLSVVASGRSATEGMVTVRAYTGRTDTANVFTVPVTGNEDGSRSSHAVPPFAQRARLECGDATSSVELTMVDAYGTPVAQHLGSPGQSVQTDIGGCPVVGTYLPAGRTGRLTFYLPF